MNEKAQAALAAHREKVKSGEIVVVQKNPMQKHLENPTSLRMAINVLVMAHQQRFGIAQPLIVRYILSGRIKND